jgi:hypothetical protein
VFYSAYSSTNDGTEQVTMTSDQLLELCQASNFNNTQGTLAVTPIEMVLTLSGMLATQKSQFYQHNKIDRVKVVESYKLLKGKEGMQNNVFPVADLFAQMPKSRKALEVVFTTFVAGIEPPANFAPPIELQLTTEFYKLPTKFKTESNLSDDDLADAIAHRFQPIPLKYSATFKQQENLLVYLAKRAHWRREIVSSLFRRFPKVDDKAPQPKLSEVDKWEAVKAYVLSGSYDDNFTGSQNPAADNIVAMIFTKKAPANILPTAWQDAKAQDKAAAVSDAAVAAREAQTPALANGLIDNEAQEVGPPEQSDIGDDDDDLLGSGHKAASNINRKSKRKSTSTPQLEIKMDLAGTNTQGTNTGENVNAGNFSLSFSCCPLSSLNSVFSSNHQGEQGHSRGGGHEAPSTAASTSRRAGSSRLHRGRRVR